MAEKKPSTVQIVTDLVSPFAEALGLSLWDVRYEKEGAEWYLRIFIDKPGGVSIDDCEALSRAIDAPLDERDPIPGSYTLEVSSPGVERALTRPEYFPPYVGRRVRVRTIRALEEVGQREFEGVLTGASDGRVRVRTDDGREVDFERRQAAFIRLCVDFESEEYQKR